jgi:putative flippase GtrA
MSVISSKTYIALTKFALVGGLSFFLDFSIYYGLSQFVPTYIAKSIAIILATTLNYRLNKAWTWGQKNSDNQRFMKYILLYVVSGLTNVLSNEFFLTILPNADLILHVDYPKKEWILPIFAIKIDKFFALIFDTGMGLIVNFLGQKLWVFKEKVEQ